MKPSFGYVMILLLAAGASAQDVNAPSDAARERLEEMRRQSQAYRLLRAEGETPLQLQAEPVLRWDNPVSGVQDGTVFIWTHRGRPEVAAQVFLSKGSTWMHEFQSLSQRELIAERDGKRFWRPAKDVIRPTPLPRAPRPAKSPARRLQQMRGLARTFRASVDFGRGAAATRYELRLLSRPLARFGEPDSEILDGALFAFVQGTNPEVLLLLEARDTGERGRQWIYVLTPMTGYAVRAARDGQEIWSVPAQSRPHDVAGPYMFRHHEPR